MLQIAHILVPVDFSPCSKAALEYAGALADRLEAAVDVLHVWSIPAMVMPELLVLVPGGQPESLQQFAEKQVGKHLDELVGSVTTKTPVRRRVELGDPAGTIVRLASKDGYDLIVMGTHGRQGIQHLLAGSVAEKVVRSSSVPVVTVPARA